MKNVIVDFVAPNIKYFVAASKQVVCSVCAKWRLCSVCAQWKNSVLLCFFGGSGGMKGTNGLLQRTFIWKCFLIMLRIVCCVNWFIIGYIHFFKGVQKLLMKPYLDDALSRLQLSICLVGGGGGEIIWLGSWLAIVSVEIAIGFSHGSVYSIMHDRSKF